MALVACLVGSAGCSRLPSVGLPDLGGRDFGGLIAADEPNAVIAGRDVLRAGGNAADAAVTVGLALAVALPSSAGLGAGGACLVHDAERRTTETLLFPPAPPDPARDARFRAAVPTVPRGLYTLHAKYGSRSWAQVVMPAENLARFGFPVSRALAADLATYGSSMLADRRAVTALANERGQLLGAGDHLRLIDLATVLGRLRGRGPGALYAGSFGREFESGVAATGAGVSSSDLQRTLPQWSPAPVTTVNGVQLYSLPEAVAGADLGAMVAAEAAPELSGGAEPSATAYSVADAEGNAVVCAFSMGRAFGLGLMPQDMGFLLAPSPDAPNYQPDPLAAAIAVNRDNGQVKFVAGAAGSGALSRTAAVTRLALADQDLAAALAKLPAVQGRPSHVNAIGCPRGLEADGRNCQAAPDPAGAGYSLVVTPED